jgi:hypothetical protein
LWELDVRLFFLVVTTIGWSSWSVSEPDEPEEWSAKKAKKRQRWGNKVAVLQIMSIKN